MLKSWHTAGGYVNGIVTVEKDYSFSSKIYTWNLYHEKASRMYLQVYP